MTTDTPSDQLASPEVAHGPQHLFAYHGEAVSLFVLMLKNVALTLLSLGIYMPWAKTERRKYLWQNLEIGGHRLRYDGTGKELLLGYLKVLVGYLVFVGLPLIVSRTVSEQAGLITQIVLVLALLVVVPFAIWGSRRYLLSRTTWRGIRFRLEGPAGPYASTFFTGYLLSVLSLGLYAPVWMNRMHALLINHTAIGTERFSYRGTNREAFRIGLRGILLSIVTLGIYGFWYQAELARFQVRNTWFDGAHGVLSLTGVDLLKLTLLQILVVTFSLGLAFPWVVTYTLNYTMARTRFEGPIDFSRVRRAESEGDATADGLADALDVGLGI